MAQDFVAHLDEQIAFLRSSANAFDAGVDPEAKRMALHLRVLLHDAQRGRSVSLLTRLGVKETLPWLDTAIVPDPGWQYDFALGLVRLHTAETGPNASFRFAAPLGELGPDRRHPPAAFVDWWTLPVLADREGHTFSRENFVRMVADQDGGAHVDAELDDAYAALTRGHSMQISGRSGMLAFGFGGPNMTGVVGPPDVSIALASIRQITHEVLTTLDNQLKREAAAVTVIAPVCRLPIGSAVTAARNAPCPCGGGRKFKHCFGLRQRRNPRQTQSAAIAMA